MVRLLWVSLGGALGTGARFLLGNLILNALGASFPLHTLAVNTIGSFLISVIGQVGAYSDLLSPETRLFLTTGVLGGFTTYSSFKYETLAQCQQGAWASGIANILVTVAACLVAGVLGVAAARLIVGR